MKPPVPRRLSVERGSRFYDFFACQNVQVKFDGEVQSQVKEYDLDKQWILRYKIGADGNKVRAGFGKTFALERKHGLVEVAWK